MRAVLAIVVIAVLLGLAGWVTYSTDPDRPSATVETEKIESDLNALSESVEQAGEEIRDAVNPDDTPEDVESREPVVAE